MDTIKQIDGMDGSICTIYLFFKSKTIFSSIFAFNPVFLQKIHTDA